ncbi:hypothetical protein [Prescottella agglutinans]
MLRSRGIEAVIDARVASFEGHVRIIGISLDVESTARGPDPPLSRQ